MTLIYENVSTCFTGLNSVALNAAGNIAAVCFNDRELFVYQIIDASRNADPADIANPTAATLGDSGSLKESRFIRLSPGRYDRPVHAKVDFEDTKIAFLDDETLLVARGIRQLGGGKSGLPKPANISLAAIRIETGEMLAEFTDSQYAPIFAAPLLIPPNYVLFTAANTAICLDTRSFQEVFRLRKFDEKDAVIGEKASGGEQISPNAVAYDSTTGILYVLWREFVSSFLQTYRLHPEEGTFEPLQRRAILEGLEGNSLCLRPDGKEVTVWATVMDEVIDCRTKQGLRMPDTVRFGRLGIFSQDGERFLDVNLEVELYRVEPQIPPPTPGQEPKSTDTPEPRLMWPKSDFFFGVHYSYGPDMELGVRYGVKQYASEPFYLDQHTVVINTPSGELIGVDTITGNSKSLKKEWSPIEDLCVHHEKRLLLVGTKGNGEAPSSLTLCGFD
jgi:hypothetical protein